MIANAKLDELTREQSIQLLGEALVRIKSDAVRVETLTASVETLTARIELLEKQLGDKNPTVKIPLPFSLNAEEKRRRDRQKELDARTNKGQKKPRRSGRIKNEEKIAKAIRHENVYPVGVDLELCVPSHVRLSFMPMKSVGASKASGHSFLKTRVSCSSVSTRTRKRLPRY